MSWRYKRRHFAVLDRVGCELQMGGVDGDEYTKITQRGGAELR